MNNLNNVLKKTPSEHCSSFALFGRLVAGMPCYCIAAVVSGTGDDDLYSGFGKEDVAPALATHDLEYDPAFQVSLAFKWQHSWKFWISQDRDWKRPSCEITPKFASYSISM